MLAIYLLFNNVTTRTECLTHHFMTTKNTRYDCKIEMQKESKR